MKKVECYRENKKKIPIDVYVANYFERISGLMFKKNISFGLLIKGTNSVHTFFMKEAIDVIFLNRENKITKIYKFLKPWRVTKLNFGSDKVLELPAGTVDRERISQDEVLEFKCLS